jgi:proteic killer suppression protein
MKITFKSKKLQQSLIEDKMLIKTYGERAKKIKQRINQLEDADNLAVIAELPVLRLHSYQGNREGEWSIDIYKNWRIIFEIADTPIPTLEDGGVNIKEVVIIKIVSIEDPH